MRSLLPGFSFVTVSFFFLPRAPHKGSLIRQQLASACFKDSGSWDYCLARIFDLFVRVGFIFTLVALTEHGWGERAIIFLWAGVRQFDFLSLRVGGGLNSLLGVFFKAFVWVFLFFVGGALISLI
jgi:hypothetical protein